VPQKPAPDDRPSRTSRAGDDGRTWALDALATLDDGVVVIDESGRLVYRNPAAESLIGIRALGPDVAAWSVEHGVFLPDEQTPCPAEDLPLVAALRGEPRRDVALFVRNPSVTGTHLLCSATTIRDRSGTVRGAACIFHDVTDRRRAELRHQEGERQKKAILDNIPDMAWLKDHEGRYVAANQPFAEAAGKRTVEEVIGLADRDLWPAELAERYRAGDAEIMQSGRGHKRVEEPFIDANGRSYWIETIKTSIVTDRGEVIGTTGIARDITERKLAEEALRMSNDELERRVRDRTTALAEAQENLVRKERLAVLGQLAGGVAHQIRNPLAAIMNATYVLKRHLSPEQHPNVEDAIRIIHDEVRHANVIITGLLDYARVRTPDRHPTAIVDLVDRVLGADWIPPTIRVERRLARDVPSVDLDADQLHGALFNVIRNAVEAMPDGGTLSVDLDVDGEAIVIAVSDTGPGISPQVRAHLFEPLHSTKPMGIGLGLVTARTFVEAHGGRIAAVPVREGAKFEIRLPIASGA
jgi:PAS domain S-box-containing protein